MVRVSGFDQVEGYLHVYVDLEEGLRDLVEVSGPPVRAVRLFAHYIGDEPDQIRARFNRVHDCVLYERRFGG